ncbi:hypothetical protein B0J15DRAFT_562578 [Fusarium solani]|uniref:Uncharacterized protein n=1 Tax=Fusarium solani TaxID=169388 RepID=A0A9P9GZI7_FUSSL|nr:uncharacterized protein B0J15DRAFT_562578 [Fusarium solani]KAH7248305.1 hypothetical protein B0J15DRAFT_562578 [Fusarium solani]
MRRTIIDRSYDSKDVAAAAAAAAITPIAAEYRGQYPLPRPLSPPEKRHLIRNTERLSIYHIDTSLPLDFRRLVNVNKLPEACRSLEGGGGLDDEGVDKLEDEERQKLERKIRALESEVHELRSGAWIGKRRELEATSPGFHDVDLSPGHAISPTQRRKSGPGGIGEFLTSGLNALAGGNDDELLIGLTILLTDPPRELFRF